MMGTRLFRFALRHDRAITLALVLVLVTNVTVLARFAPAEPQGDLPLVSSCQGGPTCADQPLIPPPAGGLPRFDAPADPVYGLLLLVEPAPLPAMHAASIPLLEPPPELTVA
jgi:hypothetical protein